jgi:hypothetical protein
MDLNTQYPWLGRRHPKKGLVVATIYSSFNFVEIYQAICEVGSSTFCEVGLSLELLTASLHQELLL